MKSHDGGAIRIANGAISRRDEEQARVSRIDVDERKYAPRRLREELEKLSQVRRTDKSFVKRINCRPP
jgi:hypothetical protein